MKENEERTILMNVRIFTSMKKATQLILNIWGCSCGIPCITLVEWDLACQERKWGGTSASRDENGQMDL